MKRITCLLLILSSILTFSQEEKTDTNNHLETENVPFAIIENVPIYAGCDENLSNLELKQCMSSKMISLVSNNFNSSMAYTLGLDDGTYRINVLFKINTEGNIQDIQAHGPHPFLEKEAIRVVKLIPKFAKPGYIKGRAVTVPYSLPIAFKVENSKKDKKKVKRKVVKNPDQFPVYKRCHDLVDYDNIKACTTQKIMEFIQMGFDIELASKLFPTSNSTQFKVDFIINKKGKIEQVTAKAHKKEIAVEAIKVVKRIPKLKKPGYLNGEPVAVPFSVLMTVYFD